MSRRAVVAKTYKLYLGGKFARSESGRSDPATDHAGEHVGNIPRSSRKDVRDAVKAARGAQAGWAARTAYNRGQVLYRFAEALESRSDELARAAVAQQDAGLAAARAELGEAVDTLVHYAGWTDKLAAVMGGINPVAAPYLSFSTPEPTGVVAVLAPDEPDLLGLIREVAPALAAGNTVVALDLPPLAAARARPRRGRGRLRRPGRRAQPAQRADRRAARRRCAATATSTRSSTRPATPSAAATIDELAAETVKRVSRPEAGGELARAPGGADRAQDRLAPGRRLAARSTASRSPPSRHAPPANAERAAAADAASPESRQSVSLSNSNHTSAPTPSARAAANVSVTQLALRAPGAQPVSAIITGRRGASLRNARTAGANTSA